MTCSKPNCQAHVVGHTQFSTFPAETIRLLSAWNREDDRQRAIMEKIILLLQSDKDDFDIVSELIELLENEGYEV